LALFARWILLLKLLKIEIPFRENIKIYFSGFALAITPGKFGELVKSQLMKKNYDIPRTTTAPLIFVERLYDLTGAIIVSFVGISILGFGIYVIFAASILLTIIFVLISSRNLFKKFISIFARTKFTSKFLIPLSESYEIIRTTTRGSIIIFASL
jgi:hypothetical protein